MKTKTCSLVFRLALLAAILASCAPKPAAPLQTPTPAPTTTWVVQPSLAYDTLGFFNALSGDPTYLSFYQKEYDQFYPQFNPEAQKALANLAAAKDEYHFVLSATLQLIYSVKDPQTLDDLIAMAHDPAPLQEPFLQSGIVPQKDILESWWPLVIALSPDIEKVLVALKNAGFEDYWQEKVSPAEQTLAEQLQKDLFQYNVIEAVENTTGKSLSGAGPITVYVSYFNTPHGARITGTRFIMETRSPNVPLFVRTAVHELLHQPYDVNSQEFWDAIDTLQLDEYLMQRFEGQTSSMGYKDWEGYVGESCTDGLEQVVSEKLGVAQPLSARFGQDEDENMHVLAPAIYVLVKQEGFPQNGETFSQFIVRMVKEEKLAPGKMEALSNQFKAMQSAK
ncbi:MAG: hypothetical protein EHM70_06665 [Chloroflexota bacterium]|nr:MAG: hypothetical protein EHM70_06665 [Chloroflexota bacterium]